jgi:hypothetical protein
MGLSSGWRLDRRRLRQARTRQDQRRVGCHGDRLAVVEQVKRLAGK